MWHDNVADRMVDKKKMSKTVYRDWNKSYLSAYRRVFNVCSQLFMPGAIMAICNKKVSSKNVMLFKLKASFNSYKIHKALLRAR
jgi:hypothetical protein